MIQSEYHQIKSMVDKLIAFIKWKGAPLESKQNKIIKELSIINKYCQDCVAKDF